MKRMIAVTIVAVLTIAALPAIGDVTIAADPLRSESISDPSVNPTNPKQIIAVLNKDGLEYLYRSNDAGSTWTEVSLLPTTHNLYRRSSTTYAANGRIYVAYTVPVEPDADYQRVWVTYSDDGLTWSSPVIALEGAHYYGFAWPKLTASQDGWLYVTGIVDHDGGTTDGVGFARSPDGQTWFEIGTDPDSLLARGNNDSAPVRGVSIAAGGGGEVLAAVHQYFVDDCPTAHLITVMRSVDHGATFGPPTVAASAAQGCYAYLSAPNIKIGAKGAAHLVYTHGTDVDRGNIEYTWSTPPYTTWAQPMPVSDDTTGHVQSAPSLATQICGKTTVLHAVWTDDRLTPAGSPNRWNVFYSKKLAKKGGAWSKNVRVSSKPDIEEFSSVMSPYIVSTTGKAFAVWDNDGDVFGKSIASCR